MVCELLTMLNETTTSSLGNKSFKLLQKAIINDDASSGITFSSG
jgi:hypothetical protein